MVSIVVSYLLLCSGDIHRLMSGKAVVDDMTNHTPQDINKKRHIYFYTNCIDKVINKQMSWKLRFR